MREITEQLTRWQDLQDSFAVASVVDVRGSAPYPPGAALAVHADGSVIGSVSGGCVEGAVYELAQQAIATGEQARRRFGYSPETAFAVGLTCGGELDVFVDTVRPGERPELVRATRLLRQRTGMTLARVIAGPAASLGRGITVSGNEVVGSTGDPGLDRVVTERARTLVETGASETRWFVATNAEWVLAEHDNRTRSELTADDGAVEVFYETYVEPARMLVCGATDYAGAVVTIGKYLGYRVTLCDARAVFATRERIPDADEVVVDWPHRYLARMHTDRRTVICVLTHDTKFDTPLLVEALQRPLGYVGALGSRRTHAERLERLREAGVDEGELERLHSPVGLDIGGGTPQETAVSIAAEIIASRTGRAGTSLSTSEGPIHAAGSGPMCTQDETRGGVSDEHCTAALPAAANTAGTAAEPRSKGDRGRERQELTDSDESHLVRGYD